MSEKPSASLTIGQREGDSGKQEEEDVQLSQSIRTKREGPAG